MKVVGLVGDAPESREQVGFEVSREDFQSIVGAYFYLLYQRAEEESFVAPDVGKQASTFCATHPEFVATHGGLSSARVVVRAIVRQLVADFMGPLACRDEEQVTVSARYRRLRDIEPWMERRLCGVPCKIALVAPRKLPQAALMGGSDPLFVNGSARDGRFLEVSSRVAAEPPREPLVQEQSRGGSSTWHWLGLGGLFLCGVLLASLAVLLSDRREAMSETGPVLAQEAPVPTPELSWKGKAQNFARDLESEILRLQQSSDSQAKQELAEAVLVAESMRVVLPSAE